jgi:hypothetical protein
MSYRNPDGGQEIEEVESAAVRAGEQHPILEVRSQIWVWRWLLQRLFAAPE